MGSLLASRLPPPIDSHHPLDIVWYYLACYSVVLVGMVWHGIGMGWSAVRCRVTTCRSPPTFHWQSPPTLLFKYLFRIFSFFSSSFLGGGAKNWGHYLQAASPSIDSHHPHALPALSFLSLQVPFLQVVPPSFFFVFFAIFFYELSSCEWANAFCLSHFFWIRNMSHLPLYSYQRLGKFNLKFKDFPYPYCLQKKLGSWWIINCQEQVSGFFC